MIDLHTHILPALDDGSRDVAESIGLLEQLAAQGVEIVVATPHFSADCESVEEFLARRDAAWERLTAVLPAGVPRILCGAEVAYYPGISRLTELNRLCIEGTRLLLLEMPMSPWTAYTVDELVEMAGRGRMVVVIAHMDRYIRRQSRDMVKLLCACGIRIQVNADFFVERMTRRRAISMLRAGEIHFLGSDCHGLTWRPPQIGEAYAIIRRRLGEAFSERLDGYGASLLGM